MSDLIHALLSKFTTAELAGDATGPGDSFQRRERDEQHHENGELNE